MNVVDFSPRLDSRYTFWSGLTGGSSSRSSYFGTDQSQVQRYLSGRSLTESRLGLLFNGLVKIPMQFVILFVGVMVFVFYQFNAPPLFFNESELARVAKTPARGASCARSRPSTARRSRRKRAAVDALRGGARRAPTDGDARSRRPRAAARRGRARRRDPRAHAQALIARALPRRRDQGRRLRLHHAS